MSNHQTCPRCGKLTSDAQFPASDVGYFVTQRDVDRTSGTEDPAEVVMRGVKMFACPCGQAMWVADRGWYSLDS